MHGTWREIVHQLTLPKKENLNSLEKSGVCFGGPRGTRRSLDEVVVSEIDVEGVVVP